MELAAGARYGRPLYAGASGRPVVVLEGSGEVRELTEYELNFPEGQAFVSVGDGLTVRAPGPRGLGMWWDHRPAERLRTRWTVLDRGGWGDRQESELDFVVGGIAGALSRLAAHDFDPWGEGLSDAIMTELAPVVERYPLGERGSWRDQPRRWRCDWELETDLRLGRSEGCGHAAVDELLGDVWAEAGGLVDGLLQVARLAEYRDRMSLDVGIVSGVTDEVLNASLDVMEAAPALETALERLWTESRDAELTIAVSMGRRF